MDVRRVLEQRLATQHLTGAASTVAGYVSEALAVQSQDPGTARWSIGMRTGLDDAGVRASIDAGVISVAITLGAHHGGTLTSNVIQVAAALIGSALIAGSLLLVYRYAGRVSGWIGNKGMEVILRLSALLVLSIGVQIVWNGMKSLLAEIHIA